MCSNYYIYTGNIKVYLRLEELGVHAQSKSVVGVHK